MGNKFSCKKGMRNKKAVLIGCNYPNTEGELKGCINDVNRMHRTLINRFGFCSSDITVLIDTCPFYVQPTGVNVRRAISHLVGSAKPGDYLFVHYSGHGMRFPLKEGEVDETGWNECIVPCDMNLITDDEFRGFVDQVPDGCRLTIVSDSCHSGGLMEKSKEQIGESTKHKESDESSSCADGEFIDFADEVRNGHRLRIVSDSCHSGGLIDESKEQVGESTKHKEGDESVCCMSWLALLKVAVQNTFSLQDNDDSDNNLETGQMKNRSLPLPILIEMLKQKTGRKDITEDKVVPTLFHMFGNDASPRIKKFMKVILNKIQHGGNSESSGGGLCMDIVGFLGQFIKLNHQENYKDYVKRALEMEIDSKHDVYDGANTMSLIDNGILISGCQTDEVSADARPSDGRAYGALSNAIQTILSEVDGEISNKELVLKAREFLAEQQLSPNPQHPGLYCSDDYVDAPFICP